MTPLDQALAIAGDMGACPDCLGTGKRGPKLSAYKTSPDGMVPCEPCHGSGLSELGPTSLALLRRMLRRPEVRALAAEELPVLRIAGPWTERGAARLCRHDIHGEVVADVYHMPAARGSRAWRAVVSGRRLTDHETESAARAWCDPRLVDAGWVLAPARPTFRELAQAAEAGPPHGWLAGEPDELPRCGTCGDTGTVEVVEGHPAECPRCEDCPTCAGRGGRDGEPMCRGCGGVGRVPA